MRKGESENSVFLSVAWQKAVANAQAGSRATGMFTPNKTIIPDYVFAPSITTERAVLPTANELPIVDNTRILTFNEDVVS